MSKILSVIIPSYNMEKFLPYCLDSLLVENHRDLLEVLIVNDGSKDATLSIARKYEENYPEIFCVIDKKNGNYGSCINAALPKATGKYVKVLDADDSFDTANFDAFLGFLNNTDADLVLSDFVTVNESREVTKEFKYLFGGQEFKIEEICNTPVFIAMEMHAVTYRRELLISNGYFQTEGISYTDQQWIFEPMSYIKTVSVFNKPIYRYLLGREGQTMDSKVMVKKMPERIKMTKDIVASYGKAVKNCSKEMHEYLLTRAKLNIYQIYSGYFFNASKLNRKDILEFDRYIKRIDSDLYKSNKVVDLWRIFGMNTICDKLFCRLYSMGFNMLKR